MKRIYLFILLLTISVGTSYAHRNADIQVSLTSPTASTILTPGGSFSVKAVIKNAGPDSIKYAGDSILWYMSIQNSLVNLTIGSQTGTVWLRYNKPLKTNDTFQINFNNLTPTGYTSAADSMREFCFYAYPKGPASDTFKDANTANNKACVTFLWKKTVGIENVAGQGYHKVKVYPNPARETMNIGFDVIGSTSAVTVKVMDATGRVVSVQDKGEMNPGSHTVQVDTRNLPGGVYVYELFIGNDMTAGRFDVQK